jgi:hypothetical protein
MAALKQEAFRESQIQIADSFFQFCSGRSL